MYQPIRDQYIFELTNQNRVFTCWSLHYLMIVTSFKLEAGSQHHQHSLQHHVGGLVEEVVVELSGVQQHLLSTELA